MFTGQVDHHDGREGIFEFISNAGPKTISQAIDGWWVESTALPSDGPRAPQMWLHRVAARHGARLIASLRRNFILERVREPGRIPTGRPIVAHSGASYVRRTQQRRRVN